MTLDLGENLLRLVLVAEGAHANADFRARGGLLGQGHINFLVRRAARRDFVRQRVLFIVHNGKAQILQPRQRRGAGGVIRHGFGALQFAVHIGVSARARARRRADHKQRATAAQRQNRRQKHSQEYF